MLFVWKNKKSGFTLSEILITLGIIGVIAVMVLSALHKHIEQKTLQSQARKMYASIVQSMKLLDVDEPGSLTCYYDGGNLNSCPGFFTSLAKKNESCPIL